MNSSPNYKWEQLLDIDDSDLSLTPVLRPYNSHARETTTATTTQKPIVDNLEEKRVRIILGPAVVDDVGEDRDFKGGSWVSAVEFVNVNGRGIMDECLGDIENYIKNGKLEQVVAIIKSCTPNALCNLTVTLKDVSGAIRDTIHHKVINDKGYRKDITVGNALIQDNVLVFSPKPSMHYLNITMRNMVKVFHKDTVFGNGSGVEHDKGKGKQLDDVDLNDLDLENKIKKLEEDFGRMLKAKKGKEVDEAELKVNKVVQVSSDEDDSNNEGSDEDDSSDE
nr:hypothetical protein [Tanacetum cinerariifolium]